jgi:cellulose synthase/poly-beta-1,6-N-acetylglucosamine synthase-like glycosyltransferase
MGGTCFVYTLLIIIKTLIEILLIWMTLTLIFQLIISLFGLRRNTKDYNPHPPKMRFLVLIPAHNEEEVIAGIIDNMNRMEYPRELYDFYVLADNCTDRTVEIAQELGAKVLEFHKESPDEPTGKSVVLKKAFIALKGYEQRYDAVFFFDADNLVDLTMFSEVNSQFLDSDDRAEVVQCYLGCKNKAGLVALFYYLTYTISNRFLQYSRQRIGLNCGIGGTGFAVRTRYLYHRGGWTVKSLTEDAELQFAATLEGRRVLWNNHVRVYDEKPTKWRASLRQRVRWAQGHWFVAFRNTKSCFKSLFAKKISVGEFISMIVQMYFPSTYVAAVLNMVLAVAYNLLLAGPASGLPNAEHMYISLTPTVTSIVIFIYMIIFQFAWGDWTDNKQRFSVLGMPKLLLSFVLSTVIAGLAQFIGLFKYKQQNTWDKTEHTFSRPEADTCKLKTYTAPAVPLMNDDRVKVSTIV